MLVVSAMRYPRLISEADVRSAAREGRVEMIVGTKTILTPLARDTARELGIALVSESETSTPGCGCSHDMPESRIATDAAISNVHAVAIGSDHGGFDFKSELKPLLAELGRQVVDVGTDSTESCDYPDFAYAVASTVASGRARFGIMIDGAGPGSAIACNKVPGIRAACVHDEFTAWNARAHNNANVITLGSRGIGIEVAKRLVRVCLQTNFEGGRHDKRLEKLSDIEQRFLRRCP